MLPSDLVGLILLFAGVAPGYVYVRVAERYRSRPDRSQLLELAEVVVIGGGCTTLAALALIGLGEWAHGLVIDTTIWTRRGNAYLHANPDLVPRSIALVLGLSFLFAYLLARLVVWGRPPGIAPGVSVKAGVFEPGSRRRKRAWVAVHLKNGNIVEGYLQAYPTGESGGEEIALQKPIGLTPAGAPRALIRGVDSVIIEGDEVAMIGVRVEDD